MNEIRLTGLEAADPLGFLAAIGVLRLLARQDDGARLSWARDGTWTAVVHTTGDGTVLDSLEVEAARFRHGHPATEFARHGDRKVQDLKHPPDEFRTLMRALGGDFEAAEFVAAYGTGVAVDGRQQNKPTSFHFTAGQQRFMDAVLDLCAQAADVARRRRGRPHRDGWRHGRCPGTGS